MQIYLQTIGLLLMIDGASGSHFQEFIIQSRRNMWIERVGMYLGALCYYLGGS
jgi:hypothetical protein